jgi:hypothetical protein
MTAGAAEGDQGIGRQLEQVAAVRALRRRRSPGELPETNAVSPFRHDVLAALGRRCSIGVDWQDRPDQVRQSLLVIGQGNERRRAGALWTMSNFTITDI